MFIDQKQAQCFESNADQWGCQPSYSRKVPVPLRTVGTDSRNPGYSCSYMSVTNILVQQLVVVKNSGTRIELAVSQQSCKRHVHWRLQLLVMLEAWHLDMLKDCLQRVQGDRRTVMSNIPQPVGCIILYIMLLLFPQSLPYRGSQAVGFIPWGTQCMHRANTYSSLAGSCIHTMLALSARVAPWSYWSCKAIWTITVCPATHTV